MTNTRLVVNRDGAERTAELLQEPAFFIVDLRTAKKREAFRAVNGVAVFGLHKGFIAGLFDVASNPVKRFIPADAFPLLGAGTAHHRIEETVGIGLDLAVRRHHLAQTPQRCAFRAQAAEIDRMIRVALNIDEFTIAV